MTTQPSDPAVQATLDAFDQRLRALEFAVDNPPDPARWWAEHRLPGD